MVSIDQTEIGNTLDIFTQKNLVKATVVDKPFFVPKKKIAKGKS